MRIWTAAIAVALAGCAKSEPELATETAPFKDGMFLDYQETGSESVIRYTFKKSGSGWAVQTTGKGGSLTLDEKGRTTSGEIAPAAALEIGGGEGPPLWIPSGRRAIGRTAWRIKLRSQGALGDESEEKRPVPIVREQSVDGRAAWVAEFKSEGLAMAFQFTVRGLYEQSTGYLLRYEYAPFTGGGSAYTRVGEGGM